MTISLSKSLSGKYVGDKTRGKLENFTLESPKVRTMSNDQVDGPDMAQVYRLDRGQDCPLAVREIETNVRLLLDSPTSGL